MKFLLGTTAIAATLLFAAPAFAQQSPYDTNPTPAERAQTDQLNDDADNDAQTPPDATPGDRAKYDADRADYNRKMDDYNNQRDAYDHERARYHADRADYAHRWDAFYGYREFRGLDQMSGTELVGLRIDTRGGNVVGHIHGVENDPNGRVARISVIRDNGARIWLDADDLRYNPNSNRVVTDLNRNQIDGMEHYPRY
jgi:hypothetical protein